MSTSGVRMAAEDGDADDREDAPQFFDRRLIADLAAPAAGKSPTAGSPARASLDPATETSPIFAGGAPKDHATVEAEPRASPAPAPAPFGAAATKPSMDIAAAASASSGSGARPARRAPPAWAVLVAIVVAAVAVAAVAALALR
jgi:hypothetical protein